MNNKEKDLDTRCPYHCSEKIGQCNNSSQETPHTYCIDNKDCIYKLYTRKKQECEALGQAYLETNELLQEKTKECTNLKIENEELKKQLMQKSEVDMFFNTPIEGWSNDPCDICRYKQILQKINEVENDL